MILITLISACYWIKMCLLREETLAFSVAVHGTAFIEAPLWTVNMKRLEMCRERQRSRVRNVLGFFTLRIFIRTARWRSW